MHSALTVATFSSAHVFPAHFLTKAALASAATFWIAVHSVLSAATFRSAHVLPTYLVYKALAAAAFSAAISAAVFGGGGAGLTHL